MENGLEEGKKETKVQPEDFWNLVRNVSSNKNKKEGPWEKSGTERYLGNKISKNRWQIRHKK